MDLIMENVYLSTKKLTDKDIKEIKNLAPKGLFYEESFNKQSFKTWEYCGVDGYGEWWLSPDNNDGDEYFVEVDFKTFKRLFKEQQLQLSRFQPLQDTKDALIKEIEKLSSWTDIHPEEPELNAKLTRAMSEIISAITDIEQAVIKYEN